MAKFVIKRSMSPDGKIDSVSVEMELEAELTDTQTILDAISITDAYASHVNAKTPAPRTNGAETATAVPGSVSGHVQAVFDGEPSKASGKIGPGAIIIDGVKVKTFDKKLLAEAKDAKGHGATVTADFIYDAKWKSNDLKKLTVGA